MNNSNNPLERVLLLMKYDSNKTLTENTVSVKNQFATILNEAPPRTKAPAVKRPSKAQINAAKKATIAKYKNMAATKPLTKPQMTKFKNELLQHELSLYSRTKLPNGKYPTTAQQNAYMNKLKTNGSIDNLAAKQLGIKPASGTVNAPSKTSQQAGVTQNQKVNQKTNINLTLNLPAKTARTRSGGKKILNPKGQGQKGGTKVIPAESGLGTKIINWVRGGWSFRKILKRVALFGIGAYALWWFFWRNSDKTEVPDDTPENPPQPDNTNTGGGGTPSGNYTQCAETFPIKQYCKNETIAKIQNCLGIVPDGKFGPKTQAALEAKGLPGTEITQDSLNKACQSSTGGNTSTPEYYDDYQTDEVETTASQSNDTGAVEGEETTTTNTTTTTQSTNSPAPNKKMFYPNPEEEYQ